MDLGNITVTEIISAVTVYSKKGRLDEIKNRAHFGISLCIDGQITYIQNGKEYICYRKERLFEEGENILLPEFIPLEELLDILDVTEDDIAELDKSKLAPLKIKRAEKKHFSHS